MIPEVAAVVTAAKVVAVHCLTTGVAEHDLALHELEAAVEALLTLEQRPGGSEPTRVEQERTWGEVVTEDEILSTKTGKWYEVSRTVLAMDNRTVKVNIKGNPKPITRPVGEAVRVRRGVSGEAVDLLTVLWSDKATVASVSAQDASPMLTMEEDSDG